jgi:spore germination protein KA
VGALVLGQAAIQAGFVPPALVIVSLLSSIASFAIPRAESLIVFRVVRFPLLFLASILGMPGLTLGVVALIYHLASLKTFGVPFFSLYAPGKVRRLTRKLILAPYELRPAERPLDSQDKIWKGVQPKPRDPRKSGRENGAR